MQIQLSQAEIKEALAHYIAQQGIDTAGKVITVTFIAGRKDAGLTAGIKIEEPQVGGLPIVTDPSLKPDTIKVVGKTEATVPVNPVTPVKAEAAVPAVVPVPETEAPLAAAAQSRIAEGQAAAIATNTTEPVAPKSTIGSLMGNGKAQEDAADAEAIAPSPPVAKKTSLFGN